MSLLPAFATTPTRLATAARLLAGLLARAAAGFGTGATLAAAMSLAASPAALSTRWPVPPLGLIRPATLTCRDAAHHVAERRAWRLAPTKRTTARAALLLAHCVRPSDKRVRFGAL
jgi:hypothetical protein